jgi:hypothetical protein
MLSDVTGFSSPANDGLVVERGGGNDLGITIATNNDRNGYLLFADSDSSNPAWVGYDHSVNAMSFRVNASERARIDSSGRLLVGTSSDIGIFGQSSRNLQVSSGTGATDAGLAVRSFGNNANCSAIDFIKSRGTGSTNTVVQDGDNLGNIFFAGADGTNYRRAADIQAFVDGTPGADDMPGRLVFSTTADGASSPTERMRITSDAYVRLASGTGGIQFNGDTAAANALDDYEEGTWTPSVGGTATYTDQTGFYTKIGRTVTASFKFAINSIGTGSTFNVSGIPFATADVGRGGVYFYYWVDLAQSTVTLAGLLGTTSFDITGQDTAAVGIDYQKPVLGNNARVDGMLIYQVV